MPTKTDRILSHLPQTFRPAPQRSALYAVTDTFGNELLLAENSLAAIMMSHWVDHADRGAELIHDLRLLAALYGLAPRPDESVEEFREHLKRYIRTFLEGTVTVQGILRVTAEALGLHIADDYKDLDTWWTRDSDTLLIATPRRDDAAEQVLGFSSAQASGTAAQAARVVGTVDLSTGVDLSDAFWLRLQVDNTPLVVDFRETGLNLPNLPLDEVIQAINDKAQAEPALGVDIAAQDDGYLTLTSPTVGADSLIEVQPGEQDAADNLLGLAPWSYQGQDAQPAQVRGTVDLSGGIDLGVDPSQIRYLRLAIDDTLLAEIDCASSAPGHKTLNQVRDAINQGLGQAIASHDGQFLSLTAASRIEFQAPAAQDATQALFGTVNPIYAGQGPQPAQLICRRDLSPGSNLSDRSQLQLRVDDSPSVQVNCRGLNPANTRPGEIVVAINNALGSPVASQFGRFLALTSPTVGAASQIVIETPPSDDATDLILGLGSRQLSGTAATAAQILGDRDLSDRTVNLMAQRFLPLAVDGGTPVEIDLQAHVPEENRRQATLGHLVTAINQVMGEEIAADAGGHLRLRSPTVGAASQLAIAPQMVEQPRRFITRAFITDDASQAIFGFLNRSAQGIPAAPAQVVGTPDLSRGVDLRGKRYLRLAIDGAAPVEIDCAGQRPRATLLEEVVQAINTALGQPIASSLSDRHLVLTSSPPSGSTSQICFEPPQVEDLLETLGLAAGTVWAEAATRVRFVGTVDLSAQVDLSAASSIKLGIDGADPVEIDCAGANPAATRIDEIVAKINGALGQRIATQDGQHLILTSEQTGSDSQLQFASPEGADATATIFGITPPRTYEGMEATAARVVGTKAISAPLNLTVTRFLQVALDGQPAVEVDCAAQADDPEDLSAVSLATIIGAINQALGEGVASLDGNRLVLQSRQTGATSQMTLSTFRSGDARETLFGKVNPVTTGEPAQPAVLTGEVDLLRPADLSQGSRICLAVDGGRPVEIDVAAAATTATFLDEIVTAINAVFPGMTTATDTDRLQLKSPTVGETSHLALVPLRSLDLIEYPPLEQETAPQSVSYGDQWPVQNTGVAEVFATAEIKAPQGAVHPTLVNTTLGWQLRLLKTLRPGDQVQFWRDVKRGLQAKFTTADGTATPVKGCDIWVGPFGAQGVVPFTDSRRLCLDAKGQSSLQLDNPLTSDLVRLRTQAGITQDQLTVTVTAADLNALGPEAISADALVGRLQVEATNIQILNGANQPIAQLRSGPDVELADYSNQGVLVQGSLYTDSDPPLMVVQSIAHLFDVTLNYQPETGDPVSEPYRGVTIGGDATDSRSLVRQLNSGSTLVRAETLAKETVLTLPPGKTQWLYQECYGSRFNAAHFNPHPDQDKFAGGTCEHWGVFNVSQFSSDPPAEPVAAVFAPSPLVPAAKVEVSLQWVSHTPGAFQVNLPLDLPPRFGARFNQSYFSQGSGEAEVYEKVVTEPKTDPDYLVSQINASSSLVTAELVGRVPLGWQAITMPFRKPQTLTLGSVTSPAQIYVTEKDLDGFIQLKAKKNGAWGNQIAVSARPAGPALYDVAVSYAGARFENARQIVLAGPLPELTKDLLRPGSVGILQAKAAGVQATASRDFQYVYGAE